MLYQAEHREVCNNLLQMIASICIGLNFYSLYLRRNADGSQSESIAQLANGVESNFGRDVSVQPNLDTQIKVPKTLKHDS